MSKHVLILGAGVSGLAAAQGLQRAAGSNLRITLVDHSDVHVLKADLYEVATAYNKEITEECLVRLRSTVATPILSLIDPQKVHFIQDEVLSIDPKKKTVKLKKNKTLTYNLLIVAMGAISNNFKAPGIEKLSHPLRTVQDALRINCDLDQFFLMLYKRGIQKNVYITVGGGGATGIEMASELTRSLSKLCRKYSFPRAKVHVELIQSGKDLGGLDEKGTAMVVQRLETLGVSLYRGYRVKKMTLGKVVMQDSNGRLRTLPSDFLIWTAGVKVNSVVANCLGEERIGGALRVDSTLKSMRYDSIFAAGDNAFFEDAQHPGSRVPMLATVAQEEGRLLVKNVCRELQGHSLKAYKISQDWLLLPLGGQSGLFKLGPWYLSGFCAWFLRRLVILKYHLSVLPFGRAIRKWKLGDELFRGND